MKSMMILTLIISASTVFAGTEIYFANQTIQTKNLLNSPNGVSLEAAGESVLQFHQPITEQDKSELTSLGVRIYRYLPDDALIVKATNAQLKKISKNKKINGILAFQGRFKISTHFSTMSVFSKNRRENVLISAFREEDVGKILLYLRTQDNVLRVIERMGRHLAVRMNAGLIAGLAYREGIEFVEPLNPMVPMAMDLGENLEGQPMSGDFTDLSGFETGTRVMNFDSVWAQGYRGEGQIASMADTGMDSGNLNNLKADFVGGVTHGQIFGVGAKTWEDTMGHGTHVAGSIVGRGTISGGKLLGGAHQAQFIPQTLWSPIIDNLTVPPKLSKLFEAAYTDGARIHSNSWGAARNFGTYDSMAQQVDEFMWAHPDFLILFAAGNSGVDMDKNGVIDTNSIGSPGTAKDALTVGASKNLLSVGGIQKPVSEMRDAKDHWATEPIWSSHLSENANGLAMFSSRGPTVDNRTKPEIVAPGTNILSVRSSNINPPDQNFWGAYSKDYMFAGGTSMATPLTAGAATVTREVLIKKFAQKNPSAALIKAILLHTAFDLYPGQFGEGAPTQELKTKRPNSDEGYGRVDMAAVAGLTERTLIVDSMGVAQDQEFKTEVELKSAGRILANLVYTDAPGTPSAGMALVNDLDLSLRNSSGDIVVIQDRRNPHEVIEKDGLPAGKYVLLVKGFKVPMGNSGKQPFALVVTTN